MKNINKPGHPFANPPFIKLPEDIDIDDDPKNRDWIRDIARQREAVERERIQDEKENQEM